MQMRHLAEECAMALVRGIEGPRVITLKFTDRVVIGVYLGDALPPGAKLLEQYDLNGDNHAVVPLSECIGFLTDQEAFMPLLGKKS